MTRIANRGYCNMKAGADIFDATNKKLPTYQEIISTEKFIISGDYENNQLVKEDDVTKYTGKTVNNCIVWGEYKISFNENQYITQMSTIPLTFHITLCYKPDVPVKISVKYGINYLIINGLSTTDYTKTGTATINISNPSANEGVFGMSVTKTDIISPIDTTSILFNRIFIDSVTISPINSTDTSAYNYVVENRGMTKCDSSLLSIKTAILSISDYVDDTSTKTESSKASLNLQFNAPTGTTIQNNIVVGLLDMNYSEGYSTRPTYSGNFITFPFGVGDIYGRRGYKLPFYKVKIIITNELENQTLYLYAIFDPRTTNTGIELTDLINEIEPISEE